MLRRQCILEAAHDCVAEGVVGFVISVFVHSDDLVSTRLHRADDDDHSLGRFDLSVFATTTQDPLVTAVSEPTLLQSSWSVSSD
jgi:hypothetical protein